MEVDTASVQSSSSISSPPRSPQNADTIRVAHPPLYVHPRFSSGLGGGVANTASATSATAANNAAAHAANPSASSNPNANGTAPDKPKRQRKKKEVGPDGNPVAAPDKPKKPRKPREPKDKTAAAATGTGTSQPRKKVKTEEKGPPDASTHARQPTITAMVRGYQPPSAPAYVPSASTPQQQHQYHQQPPRPLPTPQNRSGMSDVVIKTTLPPPASSASTSRPTTSGQSYYDPIRGSTMESTASRPNPPSRPQSAQASPHVNRASASPSIASLIDPPAALKMSAPPAPYSPPANKQPPLVPSQHHTPPPSRPASTTFVPPPTQASPFTALAKPEVSHVDGAMEIDPPCEIPNPPPEIKVPPQSSKSSSSAPTPKRAREKSPPPKGTGTGMLSSADLLGGASATNDDSTNTNEARGVNIDIHIRLDPNGGNNINIAQEIVKKYGRDAINPRAAAHREQLLRVAVQAEKLGGGAGGASTDDMSVDLVSENEGDSNVEMGGLALDDERSGTGADGAAAQTKPARKRRKKVEEYDKEDDFIDDTELAWQEQMAVAKDGFFVYSGPLVPEGETPRVESSSSAPTRGGRGGRGRGRGRGAAAAAASSTTATHASLATDAKARDSATTAAPRSRGRGRGTGAPRKPRITKADRERMEAEKLERAGAGAAQSMAATGPSSAPPSSLAPTPTPTPMPMPVGGGVSGPGIPIPQHLQQYQQQQQHQQQGHVQQANGTVV